ncbi:MAG TPA: winged helix-turn-helix domain-containing protein [Terriglobales bacterium]|nr:winged helix-turn-helix domain-containing protein [Terriglobales bacterium]
MRFGAFNVDLHSGEIYRHGIRLKLQDQPFQVLALLLEHPGDVVTREELRQALWPADTFVDFDTSLNSAMKKLRDVLGDSAEEPRYIETLPRRGYRFIAQVQNGDSAGLTAAKQDPVLVLPQKPVQEAAKHRHIAIIAGGAALVAALAGLGAWRMLSTRPALKRTDVILLANFTNRTGDPIFDNSLDKALQVKLTESPFLSLLPESDVAATMRMMRRSPDERVNRDLGIEICRRQGLKAVVVPEIDEVGSTYVITLDAIDAQSGKSIAESQVQAESKDRVIAELGKAGANLRRQLGESLGSLKKYDSPLDLATTGSLEALQAYRSGLTLYRRGKQEESILLFQRAVELDPEFGSAYLMLGMAYNNVGDIQASKSNFEKAGGLKDRRLTEEENLQATALYDSAITGDLEREIAVLDLYKQEYPRTIEPYNLAGRAYALTGQMDLALHDFDWALEHSRVPSASYNLNTAHVLIVLGRFDEAKNILNQWKQKGPLTPSQRFMLYRIAFLQNDSAAMQQLERQIPPDDVKWIDLQIEVAFLEGHFKKLRTLSDALVKSQKSANRLQNAGAALAWHGLLEALAGNFNQARDLCRQAESISKDNDLVLDYCAKALGHAGDLKQSEELAARKAKLLPEDTRNQKLCEPEFYAILARKNGHPDKAVEVLAVSTKYEQNTIEAPYERALSYLANQEPGKAASEFEMLLKNRGWDHWEAFAPPVQLGLARAYAMQGDREKSRKAYDDFFTMWKDADPNIPILLQAKAEYKKLALRTPAAEAAKTQ